MEKEKEKEIEDEKLRRALDGRVLENFISIYLSIYRTPKFCPFLETLLLSEYTSG